MYQSVYFDRKKSECYIRDSDIGWQCVPVKPTYYRYDPKGTMRTLNGYPVTPCDSYEKDEKGIFEKDIDPVLRTLTELYLHDNEASKNHRIGFLDIETEIGGALTMQFIESAPMPVTAIALYDKTTDIRYVLILDKEGIVNKIEEPGKIILPFKTERQLLTYFLQLWEQLDLTIVVTWNGEWFDMPYLFYRIKNVISYKDACRLSPLGIVEKGYYQKEGEKLKKRPTRLVKIAGISSLDYLLLYKKFIPKKQVTYKLDYIGKKEVDMGKIPFKGNLNTLFKTDIDKFIAYNLNDVDILIKLDAKLRFIDLTLMVCHTAHTAYENIYYSSLVLDAAIYTFLRRKGIVSPNKPVTDNPALKRVYLDDDAAEKEIKKFKGAYVKDVQHGVHEWLTDEDLARLYPSNIQTINIGLETMVCRILNEPDDLGVDDLTLDKIKEMDMITIQNPRGKTTELTSTELVEYIVSNKYTISGNGIIFRTDITSAIAEVLEDWNEKRGYYKNLMKDAMGREDYDQAKFYDIYQQVFKVFSNSIYGCLALVSFRYTDHNKWLSTATTLTGQVVIKNSIQMINEYMNRELGTKDEDFIVASDTDSMYIKCFPIIQKRMPGVHIDDEETIIPVIQDLADELKVLINNYYDEIALSKFNCTKHYFEIKPEYTIRSAFWSEKKKYALLLIRKEGKKLKPGDEYDFKGLDSMKSSFPVKYKEFYESMVKGLLHKKEKPEIDKLVLDFKQYIMTCPIVDAVLPARVNDLDKYVERGPNKGMLFSVPTKGTQAHIKSAIFYNDWLKHMGLDRTYELITGGDSLYYTYLKENPLKLETMGFHRDESPELILEFIEKYGDRNQNYTSQLLNKVDDVYEKVGWGRPILNSNVSKLEKLRNLGKAKTTTTYKKV